MENKNIALIVASTALLFSASGCMVERTAELQKRQRKISSLEEIFPSLRKELLTELETQVFTEEELEQWTFKKLKDRGTIVDYSGLAPHIVKSFKNKITETTDIIEFYGIRNDYFTLKTSQEKKRSYELPLEARLDILRFRLFTLQTLKDMERAFPTKEIKQETLKSAVAQYVLCNCGDFVGLEGEHLKTRMNEVSNRVYRFVDYSLDKTKKDTSKAGKFRKYCMHFYKGNNPI